eukprot:11178054-Lingulodinium_polyedra.AAC.1
MMHARGIEAAVFVPSRQRARVVGVRLGAGACRRDHEERQAQRVREAEFGAGSEDARGGPRPPASQASGAYGVGDR